MCAWGKFSLIQHAQIGLKVERPPTEIKAFPQHTEHLYNVSFFLSKSIGAGVDMIILSGTF